MAEAIAEVFGRKACPVPGYEAAWVQFKTSGYPRKLRREWDAADNDGAWAIIARYIVAWEISDVDGRPVDLPPDGLRPLTILDNVEDAVVVWLTRAFTSFWLVELTGPRPNSSGPSPAT